MTASENPRSSITDASSVYMTPIRLWSTLVIHSCHRYGRWPLSTTQARIPRIPSATAPDAIIGIGWSIGIADQLSLPSIGGPEMRLRGFRSQLRPRTGRELLGRDGVKQRGIVEPISRSGAPDRLTSEFRVAVHIQNLIAMGCARYPVGKRKGRDDVNIE